MGTIQSLIKECFPFPFLREHQLGTIEKIVNAWLAGKKFVLLRAATGAGKSCIAYTAAKVLRKIIETKHDEEMAGPFCSLTPQMRSLQKQYATSFDIPILWGSEHYACPLFPEDKEVHFGGPLCRKDQCIKYSQCDYVLARRTFTHTEIGTTNISFLLNAEDIKPTILVIDEAHRVEQSLCGHFSLSFLLSQYKAGLQTSVRNDICTIDESASIWKVLQGLLQLNTDEKKENILPFLYFLRRKITGLWLATDACKKLMQTKLDLRGLRKTERDNLQAISTTTDFWEYFIHRIHYFIENDNWILMSESREDNEENRILKPLSAKYYANELFQRSSNILLMSATLPETIAQDLGIEDYEYIDVPSTFPVERHPVLIRQDLGSLVFSNRTEQLPKFVKALDETIEKYFLDCRVVVHSISFENAQFILDNSSFKDRMIIPKTEDLLEIQSLLSGKEDAILVGPQMLEGLDLKDDLCRGIIFLKVPWGDLGNKWIKEKMITDSEWYVRSAVISWEQGVGRGCRSSEDFCISVCLDEQFIRLIEKGENYMSQTFRERIHYI